MTTEGEASSSSKIIGSSKIQDAVGRAAALERRAADVENPANQRIGYTRDVLMELKTAPLSRKKPKAFVEDSKIVSLSCLKGGRQTRQKRGGGGGGTGGGGGGRERSDTPPEDPARPPADRTADRAASEPKKPIADPRERVRAEEEGIVLSPQRRSFTTGCQAPPPAKPKDDDTDREVHRELPTRRIGSGRIVARDEGRARGAGARFDRFEGRMDKADHRDRERERFDEKRGGDRDRDMRERRERGFGRDWMSGGGGSGVGGGGGGYGRDAQDVRVGGYPAGRGDDGRGQPGGYPAVRGDDGRQPGGYPSLRGDDGRQPGGYPSLRGDDGRGQPGRDRRRQGRGDRRDERRRHEQEAAQPEWFSAGPTSQHDMIELRGFDDPEDEEEAPAAQQPQPETAADQPAHLKPTQPAGAPELATPAEAPFLDDPAIQSTIQHHRPAGVLGDPADFDLDDILRLDMESLPLEAVVGGGSSSGSRFSRWFQRQSPPQAATAATSGDERRSSLQDELVGNILNGMEDLTLKLPAAEPEAYFAPISPAHGGANEKAAQQGGDILTMLQRQPQPTDGAVRLTAKLAAMGGKTHSVADLEADVRPPDVQQQQQGDADAFRRLVSQLRASEQQSARQQQQPQQATLHVDPFGQLGSGGGQQPVASGGASVGAGASGGAGAPLVRPAPVPAGQQRPPSPPSANVTQDNLLRLLHVQEQQQQEQLRRREHQQHQMAVHNLQQLLTMQRTVSPVQPQPQPPPQSQSQPQPQPPPPPPAAAATAAAAAASSSSSLSLLEQLMAVPEARSILIGLQTGRFSRQHLIQQLHSQVQPRLREIIVAVLRLPQRCSPLPEPLQSALRAPVQPAGRGPSPQLHHLGVAPAPPHRVPSPQEIRIHTQNILQQALIKRKLEEQKENFRKRQENRERSPLLEAGGSDVDRRRTQGNVPASLAFTPTSVIRNMKAEPRGSPEHRPKGRPLVKTQPEGGHPAMSAANIQSVAAKLLETRVQMQQQQQWMRPPQPQPTAALAANPLARWFSPEVLASAQAARMPMAPAQHRVLSVEELERHQVIN